MKLSKMEILQVFPKGVKVCSSLKLKITMKGHLCANFRRRKLCIVISLVWLISAAIGFTPIILKFAQRDGGTDDGRDNNVNEGKYN